MKDYITNNVGKLWSFDLYPKAYEGAKWFWRSLPFTNDINLRDDFHFDVTKKFEDISILELGSAMGGAYDFLKNQNNIDTSNFTGIEVSDVGIEYCKKKYPNAKWIHTDFDKYTLENRFDYSFERHAIHHMPNPLKQYEKVLQNTNYSFTTTFRGCINGPTISDLDVGYFVSENGKYFMNIINFEELIILGLKHGFNNIRIDYRGLHEEIPKILDENKMVLSGEIDRKKILLSRFIISFRKDLKNKEIKINLIRKKLYSPKYFFIMRGIEKKLKEIKNAWT